MGCYFTVRVYNAQADGNWMPVKAPVACSMVDIENGSGAVSVGLRGNDQGDVMKRLPPSSSYEIRSAAATWDVGDTICEVCALSGGPSNITVCFVR